MILCDIKNTEYNKKSLIQVMCEVYSQTKPILVQHNKMENFEIKIQIISKRITNIIQN